jgi:regulator of replication initiation timing
MRDKEVENRLKMLEKQISVNGDELGALKREERAAIDALRLEVETLRRCLFRVCPDLEECFSAIRAETAQEVDPERL